MRILHVFRTPSGGLFRHVCDLVRGQVALGHDVGIFCDSGTGGAAADATLAKLLPSCSLGIHRMSIAVMPKFGDLKCIASVANLARERGIDVLHGHGAKGGLYARLAGLKARKKSVYTPHGGSLHYNWLAVPGVFFMSTEWALRHCTSGLAFVCDYEKNLFADKIGLGHIKTNMIHNGLWATEFTPILASKNARDLVFVGELCHRKGVDILINAIAELKSVRKITVAIVGDGPDAEAYRKSVIELDLENEITFCGRLGIAEALALGKVFVLPSRAESFPYVIIEAIAAHKPTIATKIAGLKEVLPELFLYPTESVSALAKKLTDVFDNLPKYQSLATKLGQAGPHNFSADKMVKSVTDFYTTL